MFPYGYISATTFKHTPLGPKFIWVWFFNLISSALILPLDNNIGFGLPVVPEVNKTLAGSSILSFSITLVILDSQPLL